MKKAFILIISLMLAGGVAAVGQNTPSDAKYVYTEASNLTLIGKILPTENPYHRVDTTKYKGFTKGENFQVRCAAGLAVVFRTNSSSIKIKAEGNFSYKSNSTMRLASHGFDLYIRDSQGKWLWAAASAPAENNPEGVINLISNMDESMKECLLYLPIYSELLSVQLGVEEGKTLEAAEPPFRHKVAIFGSSFTHGISTSRAGMSYPDQFTRNTGIQLLSLGCSGNCKMQPYFATVLCDSDAEAFIFDAFSNPNDKMISERLFPFIERLQAAHPGKPLIFQQTIVRGSNAFNKGVYAREMAKMQVADSLMRIATQKYKDVYFIEPAADDGRHEWSVDGTHPDDYGYFLWAKSIEGKILEILGKYGIR